VYNEEANIERAVREASTAVQPLVAEHEIVVVDDGSRDGTREKLTGLADVFGDRLRVIRYDTNKGYGAALRGGFQAARGDLVFYTDSDNQFDLRELAGFLPLMTEYDAVLGYRIDRKDPWIRKFVSAGFNALSSLAFGIAVRDLNCSFKLFKRPQLQALPLSSSDFFIDTEMVARIHHGGWRYTQRGVSHFPRTAGRSTVKPSDVPRTLASIARMWVRLRSERPARVLA
jgi:dolichol-phosphate mannosyltransferase